MKWILIMWVVWNGIPAKHMEIYYPTEQSCLDAMEVLIERYEASKNAPRAYTIQCRENNEQG